MTDHDYEELEIRIVRASATPSSSSDLNPHSSKAARRSVGAVKTGNRRDLKAGSAPPSEIASILELQSYEVQARSSRGRFAKAPLVLKLSREDLGKLLRQGPSLQAEELESLGRKLFHSVFSDQTRTLFHLTNEDAISDK